MTICKLCSYVARDKFNYNRHLKSEQHINKEKSSNKCRFCDNCYSNKSNKNKHESKCKSKPAEVQIQGNNNIANSSLDNVNLNNSTNVNMNIPESSVNAKDLESYMMEIKELIKNQLTDCFQKLVLSNMTTKESDSI